MQMTRSVVVSLLSCIFASAAAQDDLLGLSRGEILEMGSAKWVAYYTQKKGDTSEYAIDAASNLFADCLQRENAQNLARLQEPDRQRVEKYRKYASQWRVSANELAEAWAGGGTLFLHAKVRGRISEEELFEKLISLNSKPMSETTLERLLAIQDSIGKIRKRLGEMSRISPEKRKEMNAAGLQPKRIDEISLKAGRAYDAILNIMPRERQEECLAILNAFWDWLTEFEPKSPGASP